MKRRPWIVAVVFVVVWTLWFAAAEAGVADGGMSRSAAVAKARSYVTTPTPARELNSIAGPYVLLGWTLRDARSPLRLVWRVRLYGVFEGVCMPSEVNACHGAATVDVVIDYFDGSLVLLSYG
jgi:hypothetical protein